MKRTFVDANVLIAAACGTDAVATRAMEVLDSQDRVFVTSDFVRLEVLPKPTFHRRAQVAFYDEFFREVRDTVSSTRELVQEAFDEAVAAGLSAIDALHVAAAKRSGAEELVTAEKPTKPMFRVSDLRVVSIAVE